MSRARADPRSHALHLHSKRYIRLYIHYTVLINVMLSSVSLCVIVKVLYIIR